MKRFRLALALFAVLIAGPLAAIGVTPSTAKQAGEPARPRPAAQSMSATAADPHAKPHGADQWSRWIAQTSEFVTRNSTVQAVLTTANDAIARIDRARQESAALDDRQRPYQALAADWRHSLGALEVLRINQAADGVADHSGRRETAWRRSPRDNAIPGLPGAPDLALAYSPRSWRVGESRASVTPLAISTPAASQPMSWEQFVDAAKTFSEQVPLLDPEVVDALQTILSASPPPLETAVRPARGDWLTPDGPAGWPQTL